MRNRRIFRSAPDLERVHIALCTWADESRGGMVGGDRCALAEQGGVIRGALQFSEQSGVIDEIVNRAQREMRRTLKSYYLGNVPRISICRVMKISDTTFDRRMMVYRQSVKEQLQARGFTV